MPRTPKKLKPVSKYAYYEESVQTPEQHTAMFSLMYTDLRGKRPYVLREDFCGTFAISADWVCSDKKRTAIAIDLDPEPLEYGKTERLEQLKESQRKRLKILQKNVLYVTSPKADIAAACNFSFNIFKSRKNLVTYFKTVKQGLKKDGILVLELAGGPGMIEPMRERRPHGSKLTGKFTYIWHQKTFDPITHYAEYAIHFQPRDGKKKLKILKDAFIYDWRLWTIPELTDALIDAGYKSTEVYWETEKKGRGTGVYARAEKGSNDQTYIVYVVGLK